MSINFDNIALIVARNEFYKKSYHGILVTIVLLFIVIALLIGFLCYQASGFAVPKYFPTTPDGMIINSPPNNINHLLLEKLHFNAQGGLLEWPEINASELDLEAQGSNENAIVVFWVTKAVMAMFELDFVNYKAVIQSVRQYFTAQGYRKFLVALNDSKNLDTIKVGKRVAFATLKNKAKVSSVGMLEGRVVWTVMVPITVTYVANDKEALMQDLLAEVKVVRVSTLQALFYGLAIYQINFKVSA